MALTSLEQPGTTAYSKMAARYRMGKTPTWSVPRGAISGDTARSSFQYHLTTWARGDQYL